jgi:RNA polymerase sigma-70 factor (ECF subfamily)
MGFMVNDDCSDLAAHAKDDPGAFGRLYDRHSSVVLALCVRNATNRSHTDAEDSMQEAFTRAFKMLDRVEDCTRFRPWLYRIARFVCSENRRSTSRRRGHEKAAASERAHLQLVGGDEAVAVDRAHRAEQLQRLDDALQELPDSERLAIHLQYLDPNPTGAARRVLGLSKSGYYKTLDRARKRLASLMAMEISA